VTTGASTSRHLQERRPRSRHTTVPGLATGTKMLVERGAPFDTVATALQQHETESNPRAHSLTEN